MRKIRVTTLLSLTGVLVAGSAAALVNTQVLGNPTPRPETMSEITAVLTLPPTTIAASVSDTTLPSPVPPTSETISLAPSASSVFDVEGVGTVTLDSSGDVLRLVSADTSPGWTVTATNQVDPSQVKVTLQSLDRTIEFSADLAGGEVTQYTRLLEDSRRHALDRMIENARLQGANAVIAFRFDSSEIGQTLTEIVAYGTGVVIGPRT